MHKDARKPQGTFKSGKAALTTRRWKTDSGNAARRLPPRLPIATTLVITAWHIYVWHREKLLRAEVFALRGCMIDYEKTSKA